MKRSNILKRILQNTLLAIASLTVALGVIEGGLRLWGGVPAQILRVPPLEVLQSIPGMYEPNRDFIDRMVPRLPYRVRTNSLGFRGEEIPRLANPGTLRVLCIGDSYTLGPFVEDNETMPARLEAILREADIQVEVINGGVSGFTITDELRFLDHKALSIEPDIVIVAFSQNDIRDLERNPSRIDLSYEHARIKSLPIIGQTIQVLQNTALFNAMQKLRAWTKVRTSAQSTQGSHNDRLIGEYLAALARMAALLKAKNIPLLVATWPSARQIAGIDSTHPQERIAIAGKAIGVPVVDLTPAIISLAEAGVEAYNLPHDGHPTAAAYAHAAEAIAPSVLELLQ